MKCLARRCRPSCTDDLFYLEDVIIADRQGSYFFASPLVIPERLYEKSKAEKWDQARIENYLEKVKEIREIAQMCLGAISPWEKIVKDCSLHC
jgi:hypothetical protein